MNLRAFYSLLICLSLGCARNNPAIYPAKEGQEKDSIILLDNHWHTGLIVRFNDLPNELQENLARFADCRYLAIGWGDEGFFRASKVTSGMVPQALFYSRGSVILVIGVNEEPEARFANDVDIYRLTTSRESLDRVVEHITRSFRRGADGKVLDGGPGLDDSRFYIANGRYGWNHTCNQWTAAALQNAGLPITPAYAATAGNLTWQVRQLDEVWKNGQRLQRPPSMAIAHRGPHGRAW